MMDAMNLRWNTVQKLMQLPSGSNVKKVKNQNK